MSIINLQAQCVLFLSPPLALSLALTLSQGVGFVSVSSGMGSQPLNSNFLPPRHQQHQFQTLTAYPQFEEKTQTPLIGTSSLQGGPSHLSNRRHLVPEFREKDARVS